jgi:GSCFA family protein
MDGPRSTRRSWGKERWHGEGVILYPPDRRLFEHDLRQLIRDHVLIGHLPPEPTLTLDDQVVAIGSCFAGELRHYFDRAGLQSKRIWIPESLNNTYALLDFLAWCVTGKATGAGFRYDRLPSGEIVEWKPREPPKSYAKRIASAGALVLTVGVAEVWEDRRTGKVLWHGVPEGVFDAGRHVSRVTTVEENVSNLRRTIMLVRRVNATAPIVLTLSPVPLKGTFRGISCLSADAVSKSILRVALDTVIAGRYPNVHYWPSYEIVKWVGAHVSWPAYGLEDEKSRHVSRRLVGEIVDAFVEAFFVPDAVDELRKRGDERRRPAA